MYMLYHLHALQVTFSDDVHKDLNYKLYKRLGFMEEQDQTDCSFLSVQSSLQTFSKQRSR